MYDQQHLGQQTDKKHLTKMTTSMTKKTTRQSQKTTFGVPDDLSLYTLQQMNWTTCSLY